MYTVTRKYEDFFGNEKEMTCYFHLTEAEMLGWMMRDGNYTSEDMIKMYEEEGNAKGVYNMFVDLIDLSYGKRTAEGGFLKNKEVLEQFKSSAFYSDYLMELLDTSTGEGDKFVSGVLPSKYHNKAAEVIKEARTEKFEALDGDVSKTE